MRRRPAPFLFVLSVGSEVGVGEGCGQTTTEGDLLS